MSDIKGKWTGQKRYRIRSWATAAVVLCSVALCTGLLCRAVDYVRDEAAMSCDQGNLHQLGFTVLNYADHEGSLPPAAVTDATGKPLLSWRVLILPFIEQQKLYEEFHLDEPWDSEHNLALLPRMPKIFAPCGHTLKCPADHSFFRVFVGKGTAFEPGLALRPKRDFRDGGRNTFLIVEAGESVPWTKPDDLVVTEDGPLPPLGGTWPKRFQYVMCDGHSGRFPKPLNEDQIRQMIRIR